MTLFIQILRESLEILLLLFIVSEVIHIKKVPFYFLSVIFILLGLVGGVYTFPLDGVTKGIVADLCFLFYIYCLLLCLFNVSEGVVILIVPLLFFINSFQLAHLFMDRLQLRGPALSIEAISGLIASFVLLLLSRYFLYALRWRGRIANFMNRQEMLLFVSTFSLLTGGSKEFLETTVSSPLSEAIPSIHRILSLLLRDLFENMGRLLLIPSGENILHSSREFLDLLSSDRVSMALTTLIVLLPPVILFIRLLTSFEGEVTVAESSLGEVRSSYLATGKGPYIRKIIALHRKELIMRGTPIIFSFIALFILIHSANLTLNPSYEPVPINLSPEKGVLRIPLSGPSGDLADGKLRKYTFISAGVLYRIAVLMRPDGEVVACLDACEICPPRGYLQRGRYLLCKYCNTPIPTEAFGKAGGCNPIPLPSKVMDDYLILSVADVVEISKKAGSKFKGRH